MSRHVSACILFLIPALSYAADSTRLDRNGDPLPTGAVVRYGSVRLWHPGGVREFAFSRDGRLLASLGGQPATSVILWDVETGKATARLNHDGLGSVAFAPNGTLYLAAAEPTCLAWDPRTGTTRPLATVTHKDEVRTGRAVAVSPDGTTVAVGCDKGTLVWLDAATGKERGRLERRDRPDIQSLLYSRDGQMMAVRAAGDVFLADPQHFRATRSYGVAKDSFSESGSYAADFSGDGSRFVVAFSNNWRERSRVYIFESTSDEQVGTFETADGAPVVLHADLTGRSVSGFTAAGGLFRWAAADGNTQVVEKVHDAVAAAMITHDGKRAAVSDAAGFIHLIDANSGKPIIPRTPAFALTSAAFAGRAGATVATRDRGDRLDLWDRDTGRQRKAFTVPGGPCLSPDGTRVAVWHPESTELRVLNADTLAESWRTAAAQSRGKTAFSPDGQSLAAVYGDPWQVGIWNVATGRKCVTLAVSKETDLTESHLSWSPNGRNVLVVERSTVSVTVHRRHEFGMGGSGTTKTESGPTWIWEAATGQLRWKGMLPTDFDHPEKLTWFSSDSRLALIQDRILVTYRVGKAEPLAEMMIAADATTVAVAPDDRWIALGLKNGLVHVWEPDGARRLVAAGHTGAVTSLTFSADSKQLLSGSEDGTALLWEVAALSAFKPPPPAVPRLERDRHWAALASAKGADVLAALDALAAHPADTVALVRERVTPVPHTDAKRLVRLVSDLGNAKFEVREKAHGELSRLGERAEPALRAAAQDPANAEAKRRIEVLLSALDGPPTDLDVIRQIRAVEVLERVGTPEARRLLAAFAQGDAAARLTREAAAVLRRGR